MRLPPAPPVIARISRTRSYSASQSWQAPPSAQAAAAASAASTGTSDDTDPADDKRVQADIVDIIIGSGETPVYDAGALAAFLRIAAPMMEQEIKRGSKSAALR